MEEEKAARKMVRGDTVNVVIGQGALLSTPLQMLRATAVIATGGTLFRPFVVRRVDDVEVRPKVPKKISMDPDQMLLIQKGLKLVVQSATGTGQRAASKAVTISGKTGTAQAPRGKDHAWFVGYAPSENAQYAIVVFLEHGGKGGMSAASIAGKAFTWMSKNDYFSSTGE